MKRRLLASILSLVMMLSLLPTAAWAVNGEGETGSDDGVVLYTGSKNTDLTDDDDSGKGSETTTVKEPQWNFAPQQATVSEHAYSYYYNSSWDYAKEGYPGVAGYNPTNAISLRDNELPDEINALIAAVENAHPTTYAEIEEIAKEAVVRGDISQQLYDRFCPKAESDGSVIFHASDVSFTDYDIRFHYDDTDKTWVATVKPCSDPTTHVPDSKAQPHLALRNCWSGNGQRYLLFRGLVTKVNYEQNSNFTGAPAAFAKFYNLTDADLANWPATQIANNTFMTTALAKDGVLDLSMLPNTVTEIGGYAFGRYDNMGSGSSINTVLLPKNMTTIKTINKDAFSSVSSAVTIKGYLTDADSIANIRNAGYTYIDMNTFDEDSIGNDIHWTFSDGKLTVTGTGAIPNYNAADNKAPWAEKPITELVIGDGITAIGAYAFYGQSSLKGTLTLPGSVKSVGAYAFALPKESDDTALKLVYQQGIDIADTARENRTPVEADRVALLTGNYGAIASKGEYDSATGGLKKEPVLSDNITYMIYQDGKDIVMELSGTGATASFSYGAGYPTIDAGHADPQPEEIRGAEGYGRQVTKLIINEGITSLGYCAFDYFTALKEVVLPKSLTTIDSNAFHRAFAEGAKLYGADGYNEELGNQGYTIQFPSSVASIGNYFAKYNGVGAEFEKVYFANPNTKINVTERSNLFSNPDTITIAVSNGGEDCAVKTWAREYNIKYKDLTDVNAVEKTTDEVNGITYEVSGGVMYINTIEDPLKVTTANVPAGLLNEMQIRTVTKIVIGSGVKTIADNAFFDYTEVTEVSLPNTLTKIGSKAFGVTAQNDKLTTISIGKSADVAADAFENRTMATANVGKEEQQTAFNGVATTVNVDNTYSVLLIGNSYSEDASNCSPMTASRLQQMLQNAYPEKEVIVGLCYSGGKTMAWHYDKAMKRTSDYSLRIASGDGTWTSAGMMSSAKALGYTDWDVVSLQPYADETRTGTGENYHDEKDTYRYSLDESLGYMLHYVHCYAPSAKTYLYMTWEEVSDNKHLNAGADNYAKIVENLVTKAGNYVGQYKNDDGSITVTEEKFTGVIPVGTAIQNERTSYLALLSHNEKAIPGSVNLTSDPVRGLQRDSGHLSFNVGRYTAALTFAKKLTGANTDTLMKDIASAYPGTALSKLPADYLTIMKTAVENAIKTPDAVTLFSADYTTDPAVQAETAVEGTTYTYKVDTAENYTEGGLKTYLEGAVNSAVSELKVKYPELSVSVGNIKAEKANAAKDVPFTADVTFVYGYTTRTVSVNGMINAHYHVLNETTAKAATCTEDGNSAYWTCTVCGKYFSSDMTKEIAKNSWVINALGHKYGDISYTWSDDGNSCIAEKVCSVCSDKVTENAVITSSVKVAATCTAKGTTTYTATFSDANGFVTQTKDVQDIDMIPHAYGDTTYTWSDDGKSCTAEKVCSVCSDKVTENAVITSSVKIAATCTTKGTKTYTATFSAANGFVTQTKDVQDIPMIPHSYGEPTYTWSDDNTSCTAKKECSVCKDEVTETVDTTSSVTTPATCTTKGTKTYTATFSAANGFVTQTKNVDIAATGHDWSNKDGICAVCHTKCDRVHKPGTTCEVCGKYTRRPSSSNAGSIISVPSTPNGTMTVNPSTASKGETVMITTKPSEGYELGSIEVLDKNGDSLKLKDLGNGKYSFVMPDGKVSVEAEFVKTAATSFADVPANAYFADAVKWAVDKGITNGLTDTMFGPYESCTRAQIVTFLWRAAGSPEPKTASSFTDVPVSTYYAKAVAWAVENGITNGMTETEFAPDATCTRGQSVTFLHRVLKGTASGSANFTDVKSDAFYADAINWAVANNVTNGTSNTTFSPNADCTRAEIVTFLYRAYQGK